MSNQYWYEEDGATATKTTDEDGSVKFNYWHESIAEIAAILGFEVSSFEYLEN